MEQGTPWLGGVSAIGQSHLTEAWLEQDNTASAGMQHGKKRTWGTNTWPSLLSLSDLLLVALTS